MLIGLSDEAMTLWLKSCGDHRRRSFELLAKPSVLVRSGGELPRSDSGWRHHRLPYPIPAEWFPGRWTVATERQGGFSPAEGPSPDASVT
jgi:hypothetical protein